MADLTTTPLAHRRPEEEFRNVFEAAGVGMALVGLDGRWLEVNAAVCTITGYARDELLAKTFRDITFSADLNADLEQAQRLLAGEIHSYQMEKRYVHKDGHIVWILLTGSIVREDNGAPLYFIAQIQDISARKTAEEALRTNEERFRAMARSMEDIFWMSTPGVQQMLYISPAYERIWGRSCDSLYASPQSFMEGVHPEDRSRLAAEVVDKHQHGVAYEIEYRMVRPDGAVRWMRERGFPIRDPDGTVRAMTGVVSDVTARHEAELKVRDSEVLLRQVLQILPVGVWITDRNGTIVTGNPAGQQVWGGARYVGVEQYGEYKGWRADTGERIETNDWAAARAVTRGETSIGEVVEIECFDGTHKIILNSAIPLRDDRGQITGAIIVNEDITALKRTETELLEARAALSTRVRELETMIAEVKQLQGILPICSYCKSIRNDQNYWQKVEEYISQHTDALFTHGICPRCMEKALKDHRGRLS